jgi:hypothetical protein
MGNAHSATLMPASISIRGSLRPIRGSPSRRRITSRTSSTEILGNGFGADNIQLSSVHIDVYDMARSANLLSEFSETSPPPHPASRHLIRGQMPTLSKKSNVPAWRTLLKTRSLSRPDCRPICVGLCHIDIPRSQILLIRRCSRRLPIVQRPEPAGQSPAR